ncbi:hypothetical protein J2S57_003069 [Kineosporia succinea]|uniref:Uncharacterized protein n=1 Tax=Kineosporia succinea TaxID=84632 RepID=A0ABT9P3Q1_9ACTN|nr:hypothetical protein [Kineosporia succinea]
MGQVPRPGLVANLWAASIRAAAVANSVEG